MNMKEKIGYHRPLLSSTQHYVVGESLICKNSDGTTLTKGKSYKILEVKTYFHKTSWSKNLIYVGIKNDAVLGITWYLPTRFEPKSSKFRVDERIRQDFKWLKELEAKKKEINDRISENFLLRTTL